MWQGAELVITRGFAGKLSAGTEPAQGNERAAASPLAAYDGGPFIGVAEE